MTSVVNILKIAFLMKKIRVIIFNLPKKGERYPAIHCCKSFIPVQIIEPIANHPT